MEIEDERHLMPVEQKLEEWRQQILAGEIEEDERGQIVRIF